jgi:hypothetical protein
VKATCFSRRIDDERAAEALHQQRRVEQAATETAERFGHRQSEPAKLGPLLPATIGRRRGKAPTPVLERVVIG